MQEPAARKTAPSAVVASAELSGHAALQAATASLDAARAIDRKVFVAVFSRSLQLLAFAGHEATPHICRQIAQDKAFTAVATGTSTSRWGAYVAGCPREEQELMNRQPHFIVAAGGLPIVHEGIVIGGIGVSGAGQDADEDCARAGIAAIGLACE